MKQTNEELLLQDLCARLSYGVKCWHESFTSTYTLYAIDSEHSAVNLSPDGLNFDNSWWNNIEQVKPYLFPLSSMTEEQTEEVHNLIYQGISESVDETKEWLKTRKENDLRPITLTYILSYKLVIDWLNKNHFDYRGLIPKGLAINCTNLNIY